MTVSVWELPRRVRPTVIWRGYASILMRPVMPLARFFYGDAHKWYFRTAATALTATLVTAINLRFTGDARWVAYLLSFAGVSVVYWGLYAPAKWASRDAVLGDKMLRPSTEFDLDALLPQMGQMIVYGERDHGHLLERPVPEEIKLLHRYCQLQGRRVPSGDYLCEREWRPPGYWPGNKEFTDLKKTAESRSPAIAGIIYGDADYFDRLRSAPLQNWQEQTVDTLIMALYLNTCRPGWRRHAILWKDRKVRRGLDVVAVAARAVLTPLIQG